MHTLKKYWNTIDVIKSDWIKIDCIVPISENWNMISWLWEELVWIDRYIDNEKIDLIIILWDRDEPFAGAIVAAHRKIPIAHIHWGDICWHLPDDYIRNAITKMSHLHFAASDESKNRIINMWEIPKLVFNVWAIWLDNIKWNIFISKLELANNLGINPEKKWILILQHPTTIDHKKHSYKKQLSSTIKAVENLNAEKIIIYPNSDEWSQDFIIEIKKYESKPWFFIFKNLNREIYLWLLSYLDLMIWNSSSWIIESWIFNLPVLNIWNRQKWREVWDNVIHIDHNELTIHNSANKILNAKKRLKKKSINPYYNWWAVNSILNILKKNDNYSTLFTKKIWKKL